MDAPQAYTQRRDDARSALEALDRRGAWLANLRTFAFVTFLAVLGLVIFDKLPRLTLLASFLALGAYVALAVVHAKVLNREAREKVRKALNERGLERLTGGWHRFPEKGAAHLPDAHLYATDLDVLGQGSLFQRLDDTGTKAGEAQLARWLLSAAPTAAEVRERQGAVRELASLIDFRQRLVIEARLAGEDKADPTRFIAWTEAPSFLGGIRWAWLVAHTLPVFTIGAGLAAAFSELSSLPFWIGTALQLGVVQATKTPIERMWVALTSGDRGFVRFEETFAAIDAQTFTHPRLVALKAGVQTAGPSVSERLARFARLMGFAELKNSGQMHPVINVLTLWDLHVLFRVERWRAEHGRGVRGWFDALAQLEALSAFAGYTFERPTDVFPEVLDEGFTFEAKGLGHPLLEKPVRNDVALDGPGQALIITGSNMSGKTTLMRTMGLSTVMALAGLPVTATSFRVGRAQVLTSMRVKDSLERGVSYFYAEVQRIKLLLDTARAHPNACLFLLDELFMGTNAKERSLASKHLMRELLSLGAAGAVTTHDLALCELEQELTGKTRNVHFRDVVIEGEMTFDYSLRPGVVTTTNALEVLRRAGVVVPHS
ncbi:MAG: DNA mismatch repair protein MutS [Myxococcaceae bacterium]|nr:DNA mismatch repair protein MutS [Myxococcaceae bacterium]